MAFVPLARGPGLAKERTREDMLVVRPDASTTQTWATNGSVCSSQFVWRTAGACTGCPFVRADSFRQFQTAQYHLSRPAEDALSFLSSALRPYPTYGE
jgi:hypothetical protein